MLFAYIIELPLSLCWLIIPALGVAVGIAFVLWVWPRNPENSDSDFDHD